MQYRQGMPKISPSDTSYAVLGLMAIRPWSTYELVAQSERSLRWFFPRAERGVYREAKRLAEWGWAEAERGAHGRRRRTVYRITEAGRAALTEWMRQESTPTQISSQAALKVFLSDQAPAEVLRATTDGVGRAARASLEQLGSMAGEYTDGTARFADRALPNALAMKLIADIQRSLRDWSTWVARTTADLDHEDREARRAVALDIFRVISAECAGQTPSS